MFFKHLFRVCYEFEFKIYWIKGMMLVAGTIVRDILSCYEIKQSKVVRSKQKMTMVIAKYSLASGVRSNFRAHITNIKKYQPKSL